MKLVKARVRYVEELLAQAKEEGSFESSYKRVG
jgi:hypothetical protein